MMKGAPRQIQLQQANQILSSIRTANPTSYDKIRRALEAWDRDEQDKLCYQNIQDALKLESQLVRSMNVYFQEDVQMKYLKSTQEMVDEYMRDLHQKNPEAFDKAFKLLTQLQNMGGVDDNRMMEELLNLFHDQPEIHRNLEEICRLAKEQQDMTQEVQEAPKKKKERPAPPPPPPVQPYRQHEQRPRTKYADLYDQESIKRPPPKEPAISTVEEHYRFTQLKLTMGASLYQSLIKAVYLFEIGVVSRQEVLSLLPDSLFESVDVADFIRDSLESRDAQRRRSTNVFKSLTDLNYSNSDRSNYSYVRMPDFYPINCSGKIRNPQLNEILNDKWVILPIGSEHPNEFSVRPNNPYEQPLQKSQYDRYELDLYMYRLRRSLKCLEQSLGASDQAEAERQMQLAVSIGCFQTIYRFASKEQKEEIEVGLKLHRPDMVASLIERLQKEIRQLQAIRAGPAMKIWTDVAERNTLKSLDRRSHYFKTTERNLNKTNLLADVLDIIRIGPAPTILNTFEGLSKVEHVHHYYQPKIDLPANNPHNPFLIMYFQNVKLLRKLHDMLRQYAEAQPSNVDKTNVKRLLDEFLFPFVGETSEESSEPLLPSDFDYEEVKKRVEDFLPIKAEPNFDPSNYATLNILNPEDRQKPTPPEVESAPIAAADPEALRNKQELQTKAYLLKSDSSVPCLPNASENSRVFYSSQHSYTLVRLFYFIYEKVVRAYQLCHTFAQSEALETATEEDRRRIALDRFNLFLFIFSSNLKSKEYSKLEENFKDLFGHSGYIFFSLVKLFEGVFKAAATCCGDSFSQELVELYHSKHQVEQLYLMEANQLSLHFSNSGRIIRMVFEPSGLMYFNLLESVYRGWFADKKDQKDQKELPAWSRASERFAAYLLARKGQPTAYQQLAQQEQKKKVEIVVRNNQEYAAVPKTFQLVGSHQDFLFKKRKQQPPQRKTFLKEAKRASRACSYLTDCLGVGDPLDDV